MNHYHALIHAIMSLAHKEGFVNQNIADFATPPKVSKKEAEFFEIDEVIAIGKALHEEALKWQVITNLLVDTVARRGGIMGLKCSSVYFNTSEIRIENNLQYTSERGIYDETPKEGDCRTITIAVPVMELLKSLQKEQLSEQICLGTYWQQTEYEKI